MNFSRAISKEPSFLLEDYATMDVSVSGSPRAREHNTHIRMSPYEKMRLRSQVMYFTFSRYWYRWSRYITRKTVFILLIIFLSYFYSTGAFDSSAAYVKKLLKPIDLLETNATIWNIRIQQDKNKESLQKIQETMNYFTEQLNSFKIAITEINTKRETTANITTVSENSFCDSVAHMETTLKTLESRLESLKNNVDSATIDTIPKFFPTRTSLHNLASRRNGAQVISDLSSSQIVPGSLISRIYSFFFDIDFYQWPITDRSMISSGDAYCFDGSTGVLTIQLSTLAKVNKIVYEHDFWTVDVPISAPKTYRVYGCMDDDCADTFELGTCKYSNENDSIAQECNLKTPLIPVSKVQLHFLSNHGQYYTCIYSIKIF